MSLAREILVNFGEMEAPTPVMMVLVISRIMAMVVVVMHHFVTAFGYMVDSVLV